MAVAALVTSIARSLGLQYSCVFLSTIAVPASAAAFIWKYVLRPIVEKVYPGISPFLIFRGLPLKRKEKLTDTEEPIYRLVFGLPEGQKLNADLSVGEYVRAKVTPFEKPRSYSPMEVDTPGEFELVVKRYADGYCSIHLCDAKPGDMIQMSGPYPPFWIPFVRTGPADRVGLVAFGVGITEVLPIAKLELEKEEGADVHLIWANRSPKEVFDLDKIRDLKAKSAGRFKLTLIYSREAGEEGDLTGRINTRVLKDVYGHWLNVEDPNRTRFLVAGTKQMKKEGYRMLGEIGFPHKLVGRKPFGKFLR